MPSVKRLVFKSVPESTTRLAMLKRGEVDLAYLLDTPQAEEVKRDPNLKVAFSGGIGTVYLDFLDQWDPKSPWNDQRVRLAASLAIDRKAISEAETLGASKPNGSVVPRSFEFALPLEPHPYDVARAKKRLAEAGYANGFDGGDLHPWPPYTTTAEAIGGYLGAVGIRTRIRTMERAAFYSALATKKLHGVCMCVNALYGNASSRLSETLPSEGIYAYGAYPDIEALYRQQARETDKKKRQALLHQIQQMIYDRVRFASIYDYIWASGVGPRVEEPLLLIDPYPWSAPLEEVKLKRSDTMRVLTPLPRTIWPTCGGGPGRRGCRLRRVVTMENRNEPFRLWAWRRGDRASSCIPDRHRLRAQPDGGGQRRGITDGLARRRARPRSQIRAHNENRFSVCGARRRRACANTLRACAPSGGPGRRAPSSTIAVSTTTSR
jgi:hypothetical protein